MRLFVPVTAVLVALALLVTEATMQPTPRDRVVLYGIFAGVAVVTAIAGWTLQGLTRRFRMLRTTLQVVGLAAVLVAAAAVSVSAVTMFLSTHDLRLVLVALLFGVGLGVALTITVTRPLEADLDQLAASARRVGTGDLEQRTGIDRADEVGEVARAMDVMMDQLAEARDERKRRDEERRAFLAAVGHDLRTPLTSIQAAVEALQDGIAPDPPRYLEAVSNDVNALSALVDDLFTLTRLEAGDVTFEPEPFDFVELVDETVESLSPLAETRGIRLAVAGPDHAVVHGSRPALQRALRNLTDNALRHAPEGSEIVVGLDCSPSATTVRVDDEGPGFPEEFRSRAFESFTKADPSRRRDGGGAGLGLAITRAVVEAHGGSIWIEPGEGGRVAFAIPSAGAS